ncbi:MAG: GGDEF domain-containing protein, partial [Planctomycetes bacterium]|nr:GGDEF domain-containing protein [Planctomycetota bacterium]
DIAFRYGGEEFCILFPETTPAEAMKLMESFRAKLASSKLQLDDKSLEITVSIGLASSILDSEESKQLFEYADEALYACKNGGRNQIRHYAAGHKVAFQSDGLEKLLEQCYALNPTSSAK